MFHLFDWGTVYMNDDQCFSIELLFIKAEGGRENGVRAGNGELEIDPERPFLENSTSETKGLATTKSAENGVSGSISRDLA